MGWQDAPVASGASPAWASAPVAKPLTPAKKAAWEEAPAAPAAATAPAWENAPLMENEDDPELPVAAPPKAPAPPVKPHQDLKPILADEPGREYGSILPTSFKVDEKGERIPGTFEWAFPDIIRAPLQAAQIPGRITHGDKVSEQEMETGALDLALTFSPGSAALKSRMAMKPSVLPGASEIPKPAPGMPIPATVVTEKPAATVVDEAKQAAAALRNIMSPTSAGPNAKLAETSVRDFEGTGLRARTMAEKSLEHFTAQGQKLAEDPVASQQFFSYVQNRTKGAKLADPELQPFADELRVQAKTVEDQLRELPQTEGMNYIEDYFPQAWKDPQKAQEFATSFAGRQGKTGFTKARKYPTIDDGLKAGLELADPNPANAMLSYITNAQKAISANKIFNEGRELGLIKWGKPGLQVEGQVPLSGRLASRPARMTTDGKSVPAMQAYAPPDYALIYNNYLSKGFEAGNGAKAYEAIRGIKNAQTRLQLGFSTHHFATIMAQNMAENVARMIKNTGMGDLKGTVKAAKDLGTTPLPFVSKTYRAGKKLQQQYEGVKDYGPAMEERAKLFASAGGRVGEDPLYRGSTQKGLIQSAKDGTLWPEIKAGADVAVKSKGFSTPMQAVRVAGRLADTVAAPLFEKYIPRMKLGAFDSNMGDWLRQNPNASPEEIRVAAKHVMDLMDERYGEIADSNIFWDRTTKQVLGTMFRAPNWNLGLVRQSFGGLADAGKLGAQLVKGKGVDKQLLDRPSYLMGYALLLAAANAAMGYLKTGNAPDEWEDLVTYETGGTSMFGRSAIPERAMFPGHPKEILHMFPDPGGSTTSGLAHLLDNKWSSLVSNGMEAYSNKNWQGKDMNWSLPERAFHVLGEPFMPLQLDTMGKGTPAGSEITPLERFMNINNAPATITAPDQIRRMNEWKKSEAEKTKKKIKQREALKYPNGGM